MSIIMLQNSWSNKLTGEAKFATILNIPDPTLLYQTPSNQLIAHSQTETSSLPIRKDLLAISHLSSQHLLLLTRYNLTCFDLLNNNQIFNLEFQNAKNLHVEGGFVYVICGCDLFCYNEFGQQQYVNHCSGIIEAVSTVEIKGGWQTVIGLNDLSLVRYRGVNISFDYGKLAGIPVSICWIGQGFLVGTQEGVVSLHEGKKSKWKAKSTHSVFKVMAHRGESDWIAIVGRKDGLVQLRDWKGKGETIFKFKLQEELVGMFVHDFRKEDNLQLICVTKEGTVRGLNILQQARKGERKQVADQVKLQMQSLEVLQNQKLTLQYQIAQLRQKFAMNSKSESSLADEQILSKDFNFSTFLNHEPEGLTLIIHCYNGFTSGLTFEEAIMPVSFQRAVQAKYVFKAENMIFGELNCLVLVHSNYTSRLYENRGFKISIPKFWKFGLQEELKEKIQGGVRFSCFQRNARYIKWISQCFFMRWSEQEKVQLELAPSLRVKYYNSYDKINLELIFSPKEGRVQIWCDCIRTLGDVFQDLVQYMGVKELDSQLWFPKEKPKLQSTLQIVQRLSQAKAAISSQMAEAIDNIKFMLVKGESSRCVGAMGQLRRTYAQIMGYNRNLLTEVQKKNLNTKQLSQAMKIVGQMINQTANVRYGKAKELMISGCREAIKRKEFPKIIAIMERGASGL